MQFDSHEVLSIRGGTQPYFVEVESHGFAKLLLHDGEGWRHVLGVLFTLYERCDDLRLLDFGSILDGQVN